VAGRIGCVWVVRRLEVRFEGVRRQAEATVVELTVWDGAQMVFSVSVMVDDETTLGAAALWAAREIQAHGIDRYGRLISEDGSTGEMHADPQAVAELAQDELPELTPGAVVDTFELDPLARIQALLEPLGEPGRRVMALRFGLDRGGEPRTPEEVGAETGLCRQEIRDIEDKALETLRSQRQ
jgi:sigma-70-like protein